MHAERFNSKKRVFLITGPYDSWGISLSKEPYQWGFPKKFHTVFDRIRLGDIVVLASSKQKPDFIKYNEISFHLKNPGAIEIFNIGIVENMVVPRDNRPYFPPESKRNINYGLYFEFKILKSTSTPISTPISTNISKISPTTYENFDYYENRVDDITNTKFLSDISKTLKSIYNFDFESLDFINSDENLKNNNFDQIPKFVRLGLQEPGKTIDQLESERNKKYDCDEEQENYRSDLIWHNKEDLDKFVAKKLDVDPEKWGIDKSQNYFYKMVANSISDLRDNKKIIDLKSGPSRYGIWRLVNPDVESLEEKSTPFKDEQLPLLDSTEIDEGYNLLSDELLIPKEKILEIIIALSSGRHVLLAGPIGTGKTQLAKLIPKYFWKKYGGYFSDDHTATSDWSTLEVIGGILPKMDGDNPKYVIQYGCVVDTVSKNWNDEGNRISTENPDDEMPYRGTWLIIDEFNRADIDKAFGQLFTSLRTRELKIPTNEPDVFYTDLKIPKDYRIIGTLNTADKHFLFNLSDALKSRFAYIEVDIPKREYSETEIYYALKNALKDLELKESFEKIVLDHDGRKINKEQSDPDLYNRIQQAYAFLDTVRIFKKLGTAILKLIYQNLIIGSQITDDSKLSLDNALTSNLIPQLEHLDSSKIGAIYSMYSDSLVSFFKSAYDDLNKQSYVKSFEKVLDYLQIQNKVQLISNFEKGNLPPDAEFWKILQSSYDEKKKNFEMNLDQIKDALEELKDSRVI